MELKSKFDVGDTVWYISNNKVNYTTVKGVFVDASMNSDFKPTMVISVIYDLGDHIGKRAESEVHKTKKELLDTL